VIFDVAIIVALATAATAAFFYAGRVERQRLAVAALRPARDAEVTHVDRPTLNAENQQLVGVLYAVASSIEGSGITVADGLRDIARTLQLAAEKAPDGIAARVAGLVGDHGDVVKRDEQRIKEAQ